MNEEISIMPPLATAKRCIKCNDNAHLYKRRVLLRSTQEPIINYDMVCLIYAQPQQKRRHFQGVHQDGCRVLS